MIDSMPLPIVVDQDATGPTQSVAEADSGSQTEKALQNVLFETRKTAGLMTQEAQYP